MSCRVDVEVDPQPERLLADFGAHGHAAFPALAVVVADVDDYPATVAADPQQGVLVAEVALRDLIEAIERFVHRIAQGDDLEALSEEPTHLLLERDVERPVAVVADDGTALVYVFQEGLLVPLFEAKGRVPDEVGDGGVGGVCSEAVGAGSGAGCARGSAVAARGALHAAAARPGAGRWLRPLQVYGVNALLVFVGSGVLARVVGGLISVTTADGAVSLKPWFFDNALSSWAEPKVASLLFALLWVFGWYGVLAALFRRGIVWKVCS